MTRRDPSTLPLHVGRTYVRRDGRLVSTDHGVSFVVPHACVATPLTRSIVGIRADASSVGVYLYLHKPGDHLVGNWLDEAFQQGSERLVPSAPLVETLDGGHRVFSSSSFVGAKTSVTCALGVGVGAVITASKSDQAALDQVAFALLSSLRLDCDGEIDDERMTNAVAAFVCLAPEVGKDIILFLDRHRYLLRDVALQRLELLARQADLEHHAARERLHERVGYVQKARDAVAEGVWDQLVGEFRLGLPLE